MWNTPKMWILLFVVKATLGLEFEEFIRWKQVTYESIPDPAPDFVFPEYAAVPGDDSYIPYNNVPQGVSHYKEKLFITMPRRSPGVPSTLNYIDLKQTKAGDSPKLKSYPTTEINSLHVSGASNPTLPGYWSLPRNIKNQLSLDMRLAGFPGKSLTLIYESN